MILQDDTHRHRVWQTKRELYLYQRNTVLDNLGQLYEVKSGLKPLSPEIHIVERCTGYNDSSGNLMYEGHIVEFTCWWFDGNVAETQLLGTIVYSKESMSFQLKGVKNEQWEQHTGYNGDQDYLTPFSELNFDEADFDIVGNIHENGYLLNVQS